MPYIFNQPRWGDYHWIKLSKYDNTYTVVKFQSSLSAIWIKQCTILNIQVNNINANSLRIVLRHQFHAVTHTRLKVRIASASHYSEWTLIERHGQRHTRLILAGGVFGNEIYFLEHDIINLYHYNNILVL